MTPYKRHQWSTGRANTESEKTKWLTNRHIVLIYLCKVQVGVANLQGSYW
jgi:hypothetical protein